MMLILIFILIGAVPNAANEDLEYADEIPIGALVDSNIRGEETLAAFLYGVSSQNEKHPNFRLNDEASSVLSMANDFIFNKRICQLMANGTFAVFAYHTMATINAIKSYSSTFRLPFITSEIAMNSSGQELGYELYMRPYYVKALADIIKHNNWKNIWYIYDSDEGFERWRQLMDGFAQNVYSERTHIHRVKNATNAYVILQRLTSRGDDGMMTFLLDLPTKDCEEVLQRLNSEGRSTSNRYVAVGLGIDEMDLEDLRMTVVGLRLVDKTTELVLSFLSNWSQLNPNVYKGAGKYQISYETALAVDAAGVISRALQRMIRDDPAVFKQTLLDAKGVYDNGSQVINCDAEPVQTWQLGHNIMAAMREIEFDGLTGHIKFDRFGLRRDYKLDILEATPGRRLAKVSSWHSEKGLDFAKTAVVRPPKGNSSMESRTYIVTSIVMEPFLFISNPLLKGNHMYEGYCAELTRLMAHIIGFNYIISPVKDGSYGWKSNEHSTWNGMIGELIRHEADIAIAPLTITSEREKVIDFSGPFMSTGISVMMKKPVKKYEGAFTFLRPLSCEIWVCIVFGYFGVQVLLFAVNRLSQFEPSIEDKAGAKKVNIGNCLLITSRPVRSIQGRVVSNVWSLSIIFFMSLYTSELFVMLKTDRMNFLIQSADDLAKQTEIKYGVIQRGSTADFFRKSAIPVYEAMWAFMSSEPSALVRSTEEGVDQVRRGKYAFIGDSTTIDYVNSRAPCDTTKVGSDFNIRGYGIATPHGSDLRDRINLAVMELNENGELQRLYNKWWYERGNCLKENALRRRLPVVVALRLRNYAGLFYILIGCLLLGLLCLIFERICKAPIKTRIGKTETAPKEEQFEILE